MRRYLVLDVVGLTTRLLQSGAMPRLEAFARENTCLPLQPDLPAVTCTVQASMLTGAAPAQHGAV
ncbi:MAG TPA: alkaline phosphatase family protein, partial [Planctomycetota bacterium]